MKNAVFLILALVLCLSLCACGNSDSQATEPTTQPTTCSHSWKAATCTAPKTCSKCSATDGNAAGHSYSSEVTPPTCTKKGYTTYTCICGDSYVANETDITDHNYRETARVEPTTSTNGSVTYTCACGDSYQEVLYATGSVGLEYTANSDGTYTVVGLGSCADSHVGIPSYFNGAKVTRIDYFAFSDCTSLTSINILDSVTSIGDAAFSDCTSLTSIIIPGSVTCIGRYAFFRCSNLKEIRFGGTKEQWNAITKERYWDYVTGDYTVYCTDGEISK